jgi:hypothetical protein
MQQLQVCRIAFYVHPGSTTLRLDKLHAWFVNKGHMQAHLAGPHAFLAKWESIKMHQAIIPAIFAKMAITNPMREVPIAILVQLGDIPIDILVKLPA